MKNIDPMSAALEAQKMALEMQQQMQEKLLNGELDPAQMASEYMNAMAGMMPDLAALQGAASFDPSEMMASGLGIFEADEDDTDYNDLDNLMCLCDYIAESMDTVRQLPAAPSLLADGDDSKWLQMGILCSGILSNLNGHSLASLYVEQPNDKDYMAQIGEGLEEAWGIENREELLEMITWLSTEGHRMRYAAFCKAKSAEELMGEDMDEDDQADVMRGFLFANRFKHNKTDLDMLGWDLGRAALLIRFGFYLGWLSENEAGSMLISLAKTLSGAYAGWQEFGNSYQFGAAFWKVMGDPCTAKENNESISDAVSELLTKDMFGTAGEWGVFPWLLAK